MLSLVLLHVVSLVLCSKGFDTSDIRSQAIIENIRRKLMRDNYDYSVEESKNVNNKITKIAKNIGKNFYVSKSKKIEEKSNISYDIEERNEDKIKNATVKSTVKYRFLKVKHQYRRNEQPRIIQEESKDGVAIVNLDKGPFPELRLPKTRRQYMHQNGELISDEKEVPPPPVDTSDPEAVPEDIGDVIMTTMKHLN